MKSHHTSASEDTSASSGIMDTAAPLQGLYSAINAWIFKRKMTVEALEKLAGNIQQVCGGGMEVVKLILASGGIISGVPEILGVSEMGTVTNIVGKSSPIFDIIEETILMMLLKAAEKEMEKESKEYKAVITILASLHITIHKNVKIENVEDARKIAEATWKILEKKAGSATREAVNSAMMETAAVAMIKTASKVGLQSSLREDTTFPQAVLLALECYSGYTAGRDIVMGPKEEKLMREKIHELKDEANTVVTEIYNIIAENAEPKMPTINIPFHDLNQAN